MCSENNPSECISVLKCVAHIRLKLPVPFEENSLALRISMYMHSLFPIVFFFTFSCLTWVYIDLSSYLCKLLKCNVYAIWKEYFYCRSKTVIPIAYSMCDGNMIFCHIQFFKIFDISLVCFSRSDNIPGDINIPIFLHVHKIIKVWHDDR